VSWNLAIGATVIPDGTRFRVWAPDAHTVEVVIYEAGRAAAKHALQKNGEYWQAEIGGVGAGARYAYSVDGGEPRPDPASRSQPDGVHAPSEVIDPHAFRWSDDGWRGVVLENMVIYELHVGTATPEGTFEALIPKLSYFRSLGVTALELMPVADFPGTRNWGYDGVDLYASAAAYGGAEGLRRLVNAAHTYGLAVLLDVVYNHFGPDGNYLRVFSAQYFTDRHHTPWGDALNLDGPGAPAVREYLIGNALHWAHEYHVDGLRLDATHALVDDSDEHLLRELAATVRASLPAGRSFVIFAEDERNEARLGRPVEREGYGLDGIWADDFHHAVRIALTGERGGYYDNYSGSIDELARTIADGWLFQGQLTRAGHPRGSDPRELEYPQFVFCIQNHDQIGNRPAGDRLNHAVAPALYRAVSALLLLAPETPLLFQGQEWAASTPFQYFTDHNAELGRLVTEGRRREFAYWHERTGADVPDPQSPATFEASKLCWDEPEQPHHAAVLALYRALLRLRKAHPALVRRDRASVTVAEAPTGRALLLRREGPAPADALSVLVNFGQAAELSVPPGNWRVLLDSEDPRYGGQAPAVLSGATLRFAGPGTVVLEAA